MTQQQMQPNRPTPACPAGHTARYIVDGRRIEARGGHFIECRCSRTAKHPSFDLAWAHWHKLHGLQPACAPLRAGSSNIVQLDLHLASDSAGRTRGTAGGRQ